MIIALAGRRIDARDASVARFPLSNVGLVENRLRELFQSRGASALVSSAACGADLIAQRVARSLSLRRVIVLPYAVAVFRERSVTDRPGDWGGEFDDLVADARSGHADLLELGATEDPGESQQAYGETNEMILENAVRLGRELEETVLSVCVWDGVSRGEDDLTVAFGDSARRRAVATESVSTV